jgi:hypothetical protein
MPLWFARERHPNAEQKPTSVFTKTEGIAALLNASAPGQWRIDLVADRRELLVEIADLHDQEQSFVCLNPEPDGSGGEPVTLVELMNFCDSLPI